MESLLRALEHAADGAFTIDDRQRIVQWNSAAEALLGYPADEVIGRSCYEIIRGRDDDSKVWCRGDCYVTSSIQRGNSPHTFDTCARCKSGELRWINVSILTIPLADERTSCLIVHLFRDASEEKQREQFTRQVLGAAQHLQQSIPAPAISNSLSVSATLLTAREREVLTLLARGLSTAAIASELSITTSTTRNHMQNIFNKLQVHSRAAAVAYAFEHGLVVRE